MADDGRNGLPEITVKAVALGLGLAVVLGAANAYLGLLAGMTVSASIPEARGVRHTVQSELVVRQSVRRIEL